jgi:hypothetical protein
MRFKTTLFSLALASSAICLLPSAALADASCNALFDQLFAHVGTGLLNRDERKYVSVIWSSTYQRDAKLRFGGFTTLLLRAQRVGGRYSVPKTDLFGKGNRLLSTRFVPVPQSPGSFGPTPRQPFDIDQTEPVSVRIRSDRKIILNEQWGPFDPICSGGKYIILPGGDATETMAVLPGIDDVVK